jgi:DnaJ-domain-containing protein 1
MSDWKGGCTTGELGCWYVIFGGNGIILLAVGLHDGVIEATITGLVLLFVASLPWKWIPALRARGQGKQRRKEEEQAKARFEQEREEIINLIHQTENIIQKGVYDATNIEDSLWLSALLIIQQDFRNFCQEFEGGGLSHADAKARFLDFREQANLLSTPPPREGTAEESKKEPTYYEVIGVDPSASQEEIKKAYRDKLKQYHPDIFMNQPEWVREQAEKMSKKLNEAYEVLGDINKRKGYDKKIGRES